LDPQPAFLNRVPFQPSAGPDTPEADDPRISIPNGVLQPDRPETISLDESADAEVQPASAEPDHASEAAGAKRKWSLAFLLSLLFHAAVAAMLILAPESILPPRSLLSSTQGGDGQDTARIGNSEAPSISGGRQQPDVTDVTVVPESELQPPGESRPKQDSAAQPTKLPKDVAKPPQGPEQPKPAEPAPEILHDRQVQPDKGAVAPQEMAPKATLEILRPVMPEPSEAERELMQQQATAAQRPLRPKSIQGGDGQAQSDAMRGASDGRADGEATSTGKRHQQTETGDAITSKYEAFIQRKLARANRQISQVTQAAATRNAWVSFVINEDGSVTDIKLDRSSGSQALDNFAVTMVKGTAPFPPIPPETGRKLWLVPIEVGPF
jgi:protein TonB